jgi:hypothetical protein
MKNAVQYKGQWLAKASDAFEMFEKKEFAQLDKHLKELEQKNRELVQRYATRKHD